MELFIARSLGLQIPCGRKEIHMKEFVDQIFQSIEYQLDNKGEILFQKQGSSYRIPIIDEDKTKKNVKAIIEDLLARKSLDRTIGKIKNAISHIQFLYILSHDGFRIAKGIPKDEKILVCDIYTFSVAARYLFELLPKKKKTSSLKICAGVMSPAFQDSGVNLVKRIWETVGYDVIDLGNKVKPEDWINAIDNHQLSLISVSCMTNKSIKNLNKLLKKLSQRDEKIPVITGGVAVNKIIAHDSSEKYNLPLYFVQGINDADSVLLKALSDNPIDIPEIKKTEDFPPPPAILPITAKHGIKLYKIRISDIVINKNSRKRCSACSGNRKKNCPLNLGYERQKTLEESHRFINSFKFAILSVVDIPEENDRKRCKTIWYDFIRLEQFFDSRSNSAYAFRLPMICPFCLPKDCRLPKGECVYPAFYRQVPETYNINVLKTLDNAFGGKGTGSEYSIILVK